MTATDKVIGGAVVALLGYELWTLINKTEHDTISERIWRVSMKRPLVPFAAGLLCGHFFWQAANGKDAQ